MSAFRPKRTVGVFVTDRLRRSLYSRVKSGVTAAPSEKAVTGGRDVSRVCFAIRWPALRSFDVAQEGLRTGQAFALKKESRPWIKSGVTAGLLRRLVDRIVDADADPFAD